MRLLHTARLEFHEFFDDKIPKYAILSHRWGDEEVSFQDWRDGMKKDGAGHAKIMKCCEIAKSNDLDWAWIDTCCIDKTSSAELSEAVNSMYRWYGNAAVCYAYLSDVAYTDTGEPVDSSSSFEKSAWWTRGWTLQELIAPSVLLFFDKEWDFMGVRDELAQKISRITGINTRHLNGDMDDISIATKMSWASKRQTSRIEDTAYCLMGIFNVNMPLLYGEGKKAFFRLQQEIIRVSDDESIFAWTSESKFSGIFAPWPDCFTDSKNIGRYKSIERPPYAMTSRGLALHVPAAYLDGGDAWVKQRRLKGQEPDVGLRIPLELNCSREEVGRLLPLEIRLINMGDSWVRIDCSKLERRGSWFSKDFLTDSRPQMTIIYVTGMKTPSSY